MNLEVCGEQQYKENKGNKKIFLTVKQNDGSGVGGEVCVCLSNRLFLTTHR